MSIGDGLRRETEWRGFMNEFVVFKRKNRRHPKADARDAVEARLGKWLEDQLKNPSMKREAEAQGFLKRQAEKPLLAPGVTRREAPKAKGIAKVEARIAAMHAQIAATAAEFDAKRDAAKREANAPAPTAAQAVHLDVLECIKAEEKAIAAEKRDAGVVDANGRPKPSAWGLPDGYGDIDGGVEEQYE